MNQLYVGILCLFLGAYAQYGICQSVSINTDGSVGPALFNVGNTATPPFRITSSGQVLGWNGGTPASPSYSFVGNENTGMYRSAVNSLGFSVGGTNRMNLNNSGVLNINQLSGTGNRLLYANPSGDLVVNPAITKVDPIYIRGTGLNNNGSRVVKIGTTTVAVGNGRGLNLVVIDKNTHAVLSNNTYDCYGNTTDSDALANQLNSINNSQIGILTSYDAWEGAITLGLKTAFLRLGLYKAYRTDPGSRRPYAAIFEASSSSSVFSSQAVEIEYSSNLEQPFAELRGWLIDGGFVATYQVPSGLSTPIGTPAVTISESGSMFTTSNIIAGRALVSGKLYYAVGPGTASDNQFHNVQLPSNSLMTGLSIYCSGSYLDGDIRINGQQVTGLLSGTTGWYGLNAGATSAGSTVNTVQTNADNQTHTCNCPDGYVAMGIEIRASSQLDGNMKLLCAQLASGLTTVETGMGIESVYSFPNANADNFTHVSVCPAGTFVKGVSIYSATYLDNNLRVYCTGIKTQ